MISDMLIDEFGEVVMSFEGLRNISSTHPAVLDLSYVLAFLYLVGVENSRSILSEFKLPPICHKKYV